MTYYGIEKLAENKSSQNSLRRKVGLTAGIGAGLGFLGGAGLALKLKKPGFPIKLIDVLHTLGKPGHKGAVILKKIPPHI